MKNLILSALLAMSVATSAFAIGENKISSVVLNNFKLDFKNAANVTWSSKTGYAKAAFELNNRKMEVFYDVKGDIVAQSEHIDLNELPINAKRVFAKKYDGYTVIEAIKFEATNDVDYYVSAENDIESLIIKVDSSSGSLSVFKKTKK